MNQENFPSLGSLSTLSDQEKEKVTQLQNQLDPSKPDAVLGFGQEIQWKISEFADKVLSEIRSKDSGYAGEILENLVLRLKELNPSSSLLQETNFAKIPLIGFLFSKIQKTIQKYEKLLTHIDTITEELHKARANLLQDITLLESLYEKNLEYYNDLKLFVIAGEEKLKEFQTKTLPEMEKALTSTQDPLAVQKFQDLNQAAVRLEKKIHDLKLSLALSLQTAPQIRLVQNGNQLLVEKIQSTILNTIPLWKNQLVLTLGLLRQAKALEAQKEVTQATNEILTKNAELLKSGTLGILQESEKGVVSIETLQKTNQLLLDTIQEAIQIQNEGRKKRKEAEQELKKLEDDFKKQIQIRLTNAIQARE